MKNLRWYLVLAVLIITTILVIPGCTKFKSPDRAISMFSDVTLATAVDSESKPINASNTFTVATETIYISLKLNDAPANTQVLATLTYLNGEAAGLANSTMFSQTLSGQGTRYIAFSVKPPPGGFPQGNYQVAITANGQALATIPFSVQNLSAQQGWPVIGKFTVTPDTIAAGGSVTLNWDVTGATRVSLQPEIGTVPATGTRTVSPAVTTVYKLTASNEAGATTSQQTVHVGMAVAGAPDLVITDLWLEVCTIYYRIKNTGLVDSPQTYTYLYVDNMFPPMGGKSFVDVLKPGEERGAQFSSYQWPWCGTGGVPSTGGSGPHGTVMLVQQNGLPNTVAAMPNNYNPPGQPQNPPDGGGGSYVDFSDMNHMIKACADAENTASEANKNNNCASKIYGILFKYDLLPQSHMARWVSNLGPMEYFTSEDSATGAHFVLTNGGVEMVPPRVPNGWIQGYYGFFYTTPGTLGMVDTGPTATPILPIRIPPKLKFIGRVGLAANATGTDGVTFKFGIRGLDDVTNIIGTKTVTQPGASEEWVIDLKDYEGQVGYFILRADAGASAVNDFAVWSEARLEQFQ